jgi:hypothetical protein
MKTLSRTELDRRCVRVCEPLYLLLGSESDFCDARRPVTITEAALSARCCASSTKRVSVC